MRQWRKRLSDIARERRWRLFLDLMQPGPADSVLDIGALDGEFLEARYEWKQNITAVDKYMYSFGLPILRARFPVVTVLQCDGCALPFEDKSFDIVFSNAVLEHIGDWDAQKALAMEIMRVGQKFFVATPNKCFPIEQHHELPLVPCLPRNAQQKIYDRLGLENISLVSAKELKTLFPCATIVYQRVTFWPETLIAYYAP